MKRYIYTLCFFLSLSVGLTSCLKESDNNVTLSNDMSVTSFSLSAVNRIVHTLSKAGNDSVYTVKLTNPVTFSIDHLQGKIYNTDSLQSDCDLKHVLATIGSKNSGLLMLKSMISDTLTYYSSTDSIDFSKPRELRVYAADGSGYRAYTVTVNCRSDLDAGDWVWTPVAADDPEIPQALRYEAAVTPVDNTSFKLSLNGGDTWTEESLADSEEASLLPVSGLAWMSMPYTPTPYADYELLVGTTADNPNTYAIWRKIVEKDVSHVPGRWAYIAREGGSQLHLLPVMDNLNLMALGNVIYALGFIGDKGCVYESKDYGISWRESPDFVIPDDIGEQDFKAANNAEATAVWLYDIATGRIWKGVKAS